MKYLKGFRWTHLNEKIAYEQEMRKQRLRQEIALAKKETQFYIQNVEKSNPQNINLIYRNIKNKYLIILN